MLANRSKIFLKNAVRSLTFAATVLAAAPLFAQQNNGYNEIYDSHGKVREEYQEVFQFWSRFTDKDKAAFLASSKERFRKDNALDPMPRVISDETYDTVLKPGVDQRARAIRSFLKDYFSGLKMYASHNVIPESVVQKLLERSSEAGFAQLVNPNTISFMYGPDIIRDAAGTWRVIEDNPGFIGGIGDLSLAQNLIKEKYSGLENKMHFRSADKFYADLSALFYAEAKAKGGVPIVYMIPPYADNEDYRIRDLFGKHGIRTVTPYTNLQMQVTDEGVFLYDRREPGKILEKVGYVMLNGEHWWMDPSHSASYERVVLWEAEAHLEEKRLRKSVRDALTAALNEQPRNIQKIEQILDSSNFANGINADILRPAKQSRGLIEASLHGKVGLNYTPGLDFVGDKEFYLYVENMIRFYLHEEPILKNIPTERLGEVGTGHLNEQKFKAVFANLSQYVIKKVDGRGGDAVWVGPKIQAKDIPALQERILKNPSEYIAQLYTPLSFMNENIVDMRVIADVGPHSVYVTDTPWGRGLPKSGNGKVNLSDEGREIAILVREGPWHMCKNTFLH